MTTLSPESCSGILFQPEQSISHGHAIERVDQAIVRSARDAFDPVSLSEKEKAPRYTSYTSLLPLIPVAAANPIKMKTRRSTPSAPPPSFSDVTGKLDDSVLDSIIWTRLARTKPDATMCVYEAEGGTCSDDSCTNIHLSRDIDPTREAACLARAERHDTKATRPAQKRRKADDTLVFSQPRISSSWSASWFRHHLPPNRNYKQLLPRYSTRRRRRQRQRKRRQSRGRRPRPIAMRSTRLGTTPSVDHRVHSRTQSPVALRDPLSLTIKPRLRRRR